MSSSGYPTQVQELSEPTSEDLPEQIDRQTENHGLARVENMVHPALADHDRVAVQQEHQDYTLTEGTFTWPPTLFPVCEQIQAVRGSEEQTQLQQDTKGASTTSRELNGSPLPSGELADMKTNQPAPALNQLSNHDASYLDPGPAMGTASTNNYVAAGMTTQVAPMILPDLEIDDEAYAESISTSYVSSIASEISRGIVENERLYPQYGKHSYGMPIDEAEMDRMDLQHRKYQLVIGDRHFLAPIGDSPQRILDLATGTGIWALDVADMFPSAQVLGVDIAPIQPRWVAPNCSFEIDDIEDTWTYRSESFDFIHLRDPLYMVRDWPKLMRQAYEHIKPGGWFELASVYPRAMCDDGSMPEDSMFKFICEQFIEASYGMGAPLDSCLRFGEYLRDAGFVDVVEHIFKMPSSPWPKDKRLKKIGALEMTNLVEGASAFGLRVFSHTYGWTREQTELAMVGFRKDVKNRNHHQYVRYYVVYGRKP
ncbi:hypothetical protein LTR72_009519 [Exophiala xenobiotica]|nr:hypothetical protein LTR72_009519 [Exophiala xenobiotica]KAK5287843.1 hypothetical protein LTR14_008626 [Exophiala xenobiotica]KAK5476013.1 hypothetical protein LTR55_008888 [Exophiala xenobiotica]